LTIPRHANSDNIVENVIQLAHWPDLSSIHLENKGIYLGMTMAIGEETVDPFNTAKGRET